MRRVLGNIIALLAIYLIVCVFHVSAQESQKKSSSKQSTVLYPFRSNMDGLIGYINETGEIIAKSQFPYHSWDDFNKKLHDGLAIINSEIRLEGGYTKYVYGYIGKNGIVVINAEFDFAHNFSEGLALVSKGNTSFYIDKSGKPVIYADKFLYDGSFSEGLASVQSPSNYKYGYIDKVGRITIKPRFSDAGEFSDGLAAVLINGKYGYIDKKGRTIIPPQFDGARRFSEGLAAVRLGSKFGFINKNGNLLIKYLFDEVRDFSEGFAVVKDKRLNNYFYIDKRGKRLINHTFDDAESFSEGLAVVKVDQKYGYINKTGKFVLKPQYEVAESFDGNLALVQISSRKEERKSSLEGVIELFPGSRKADILNIYIKYGYINKRGEVIFKWITPIYYPLRVVSTDPIRAQESPQTKVRVLSIPDQAKVYFIPLDIWEDDKSIINDENRLFSYLASKYTSNDFDVYNQVYIVVLELNNKKVKRQVDVNLYKENLVEVDFSKEK